MNIIDKPTYSLAAHYYTDPQIFAHEQKSLFACSWQFAGHISALREVGDYFTFSLAGESLFCLKDKNNEIRAFYNVCQHRAHQLVQGTGNQSLIVCPYHSWVYELTGKLRSGPNIKAVIGFNKDKICLSQVKVEIFLGFIFVNLDENAKPMDEWFPNVRTELASFIPQYQDLAPLEWVEIPEKCNWKTSVENYSECYHCTLNHPTFSTGVVKPSTYNIMPQGYCLRHTTECQNLDKMTYQVDLETNENADQYSSWFLWPLFSFQVYPGNQLNTYHWRAIDVDHVVVWRGWYSLNGVDCDIVRNLAIQDRQTTVAEDITLVESVHRGLHSRGYNPGPLVVDPKYGVNSEHSVQTLQQWIREAIHD